MKSKTSFFEDTLGTAAEAASWTPPSTKAAFPGDYFNGTLYKKNLTRWWPLWALASLGGALTPLALILRAMRGQWRMSPLMFAQDLYNVIAEGLPLIMLWYCVLCAVAVWSYLYSPRSVGLLHSLPIRRESLFVTNFLSGLTMVAIPCAVTGLFTLLLSFAAGGFSGRAFLVALAAVAGEGFFYFASATAVAFITSNVFALPALYLIFHFLMPLLDMLGTVFASNLVFGLQSSSYTGVGPWLCPTMFLMENIDVRRLYDIDFPEGGLMRDYTDHWTGVALDNGWIIAAYALAGLVLAGAAWLLYRRHRSESAGDVIAVNWLKPVFQAGVTGVMALGGGQFLYLILMNGLEDNIHGKYALFPLILCMTFAGAIGYYSAAMFLAKSLRVFQKKTLTGIAALLGCCTVLCSLLYFDAFGAETRMPDTDSVQYVHLEAAGNNYFLYPGEDDGLIEQVRELHQQILDERDYLMTFDTRWNVYTNGENPSWTYENVRISYNLKNGRQVSRTYPLYLTKERMAQPGTFDYLLDRLVNSTAMRQRRLHAGDTHFRPMSGTLDVLRTGSNYDLSSREVARLLDALSQDAAEGTWGTYDFFHSSWHTYAVSINMLFEAVDPDGNGQLNRSRDYTNLDVKPGMAHTIDTLKDMGYITDQDLITYEEYDSLMAEREKYIEKYETGDGWVAIVPQTVPDDTAQTEAVQPERMDPNSYTPPSGSLDVSGSAADGTDWPGTNWDGSADLAEVEQYASGG